MSVAGLLNLSPQPLSQASTDRLLQTIEKQRRPATAAAVVAEEEAAGPMAGLAMAAQASAAEVADGRRVVHEEESTLDLMSQVLLNRRPAGEEQTDDISRAAAVASSTHFGFSAAALGVVHEQPAPASVAAAAAAGPSSALQTGPRDKPQLEAAIAAALGRSTTAAPTPAAPAATPAAAAPATTRPALPASVARAPPAPLAAPAATAAAATPAMPISVPLLRLVSADEYGGLPSFIRQQLPLDLLNSTLAAVHALAAERCSGGWRMWGEGGSQGGAPACLLVSQASVVSKIAVSLSIGFTMADVESAGLGNKCKVVVNRWVRQAGDGTCACVAAGMAACWASHPAPRVHSQPRQAGPRHAQGHPCGHHLCAGVSGRLVALVSQQAWGDDRWFGKQQGALIAAGVPVMEPPATQAQERQQPGGLNGTDQRQRVWYRVSAAANGQPSQEEGTGSGAGRQCASAALAAGQQCVCGGLAVQQCSRCRVMWCRTELCSGGFGGAVPWPGR